MSELVFKNLLVNNLTNCWEWKKSKTEAGYGIMSFFKRNYYVHRAVYRIFHGEINRHNVVMHSCDNPSCVNPLHLSQGTQKENTLDMWRKGRAVINTDFFDGPNNPKLKFSEAQLEAMAQDMRGGFTASEVCKKYKISRSYLHKVCKKLEAPWS